MHDDRQRKVTPDAIDTRHEDAGVRTRAAHALGEYEAPHGAGEIGIEPAVTELLAALVQALLQPGIPHVDEVARHAPVEEVAPEGQLAVEADFELGVDHGFTSRSGSPRARRG